MCLLSAHQEVGIRVLQELGASWMATKVCIGPTNVLPVVVSGNTFPPSMVKGCMEVMVGVYRTVSDK